MLDSDGLILAGAADSATEIVAGDVELEISEAIVNTVTGGSYTRALDCGGTAVADGTGTAADPWLITPAAGEVVACELTNTFAPPTTVGAPPPVTQSLTVTKVVVNDGGGTLTVSDFPLWIEGNATTSGEEVSVSADVHMVSETGADNYDAVISGDCDATGVVTVASAGTASCTITNTFVPDDLPPDPLPPLPDLIFTDGFESGDTSVWTDVDRVPGPSSDSYQNAGGTNSSGLRPAQGAAVPIEVAVASIVGDYDAIFVYDPTIQRGQPERQLPGLPAGAGPGLPQHADRTAIRAGLLHLQLRSRWHRLAAGPGHRRAAQRRLGQRLQLRRLERPGAGPPGGRHRGYQRGCIFRLPLGRRGPGISRLLAGCPQRAQSQHLRRHPLRPWALGLDGPGHDLEPAREGRLTATAGGSTATTRCSRNRLIPLWRYPI